MRFATYEQHGRSRVATVGDDGLLHPHPGTASLLDLIQAGPEALREAGNATLRVPGGPHVSQVRLLPPLQPPSIRDFVTFEEHVEGVRRSMDGTTGVPDAWYDAPTFYFTSPYAVIGREDCDLTPEQARDHISAYTIYNDWSARDLQSREMQVGLGPCKGKYTATTLGPYLVTADELEPYRDSDGFLRLALTAEINGEVVGKDLLSNMSWTFEEMAAYASRGTHVRPGDVLGSGTCGNGGCLAELSGVRGRQDPPPLKPGDTVTLTVEGIGTVSNTVVPGAEPVAIPRGRSRPRTRP